MALRFVLKKMPTIHTVPEQSPARKIAQPATFRTDDGTRTLLRAGFWIAAAAVLALLATLTLLGGIGIDGPHTDMGWLAFIFALMGIPFGLMLLVLGGAKWLRNRRRSR